jgi:hypothetical protein
MNRPTPTISGERTIETMVGLARCSRRHRIIVAGSKSPHRMFELLRRGYKRVATTTTCGLPRGQYDAALVDWQLPSIKALDATLDWLVHFLAPTGALVLWIDSPICPERQKVQSILERLGFQVEAGTRCGDGLALSARRRDASQPALVA